MVPCPVASTKGAGESGHLPERTSKACTAKSCFPFFHFEGMMIKLQINVLFRPYDPFLLGVLEFLVGAEDFFALSAISSMISPILGNFPRRMFPLAHTRTSLGPFPPEPHGLGSRPPCNPCVAAEIAAPFPANLPCWRPSRISFREVFGSMQSLTTPSGQDSESLGGTSLESGQIIASHRPLNPVRSRRAKVFFLFETLTFPPPCQSH